MLVRKPFLINRWSGPISWEVHVSRASCDSPVHGWGSDQWRHEHLRHPETKACSISTLPTPKPKFVFFVFFAQQKSRFRFPPKRYANRIYCSVVLRHESTTFDASPSSDERHWDGTKVFRFGWWGGVFSVLVYIERLELETGWLECAVEVVDHPCSPSNFTHDRNSCVSNSFGTFFFPDWVFNALGPNASNTICVSCLGRHLTSVRPCWKRIISYISKQLSFMRSNT